MEENDQNEDNSLSHQIAEQGKEMGKQVAKDTAKKAAKAAGKAMLEVAKSKGMYTDKSKYDVTSTLIYGVQRDAIMAWIDENYKILNCNAENSYVANFKDKGNYNQTGHVECCSVLYLKDSIQ